MTDNLTFIHLTDLHVGNPGVADDHLFSDTSKTLATILSEIGRLSPKPSFIVASGDLTNRGDVGSYEELKRIFAEAALDMPILFALGNHDRRDGFYKVMTDGSGDPGRPYDHAAVIDGLHIVVLDSSAPYKIGGSFDVEQLAWLESELDEYAELPKLLVMHHAPALDADPSMEWESLAIADTEKLRQMLLGRNVVGILSGHIHYDRVSQWHGIPVVVGIGQHAATDVIGLSEERFTMVAGASFAIGTLRPSGLTMTFAPQSSDRRELHSFTFDQLAALLKQYEAAAEQQEISR